MLNFITQNRRGTTEEWAESLVVPCAGEVVLEECSNGLTRIKIGNGHALFKDLPYIDEDLARDILNAQSRISELVKDTSVETNDLNTEVRDIRLSHDNVYYKCAGDAVRALGNDLNDLRRSLTQFIDADAVDGLYYENNMLYLTADGQIIEESGVQIIGGTGGGGGSSTSSLKIGYITTSPLVVTPNDDAVLKFTFSGVDSSGDAVLQAAATWKVDGKIVNYGLVHDGDNEFDVTKYLKIGTTKILLTVTDDSGSVVTKNWSVQQVDIRVESNFNDKLTYPLEPIIFDYIPYGAVDKTVYFVLDGKPLGSIFSPAKISGTTVRYEIPAQIHGAHLLDVYIEADINGYTIPSNHIYKDILWYDSANNKSPVIGTVTQKFNATQYDTINIEYTVYDPNDETPNVTIKVDDVVVSERILAEPTDMYSYKASEIGDHTIKIICGTTEKVIKGSVEKLDIDVSPVTVGLVFDFNPVGKSNDDADRLWSYNNIHMNVSDNFDWINGGYKYDENGDPYFCIKSGTTAEIDYHLFGDDAKRNGKELKLIFKTKNVANPDAVFLSCIDNTTARDHIGVQMGVHNAYIYGQNNNLELSYSEEDVIEFEFNISTNTEEVPMVMGYEDGVSTRPMVYDNTYNFKQNTPKYITLGSPDCDLHIYRMKVYNTSLTPVDILNNYIADARTTAEMISRYNRNQIYDENQQLTPDVLAEKCPWLRVYKLSAPHFTNNKSDKVPNTTIQQLFKNGDPVLDNWIAHNAQHSGQGTSSNNYGAAGRNLDFIMNKSGCYIELGDGTTTDKITLSRTSVPVAYLNAKVNIASSNNLTNAMLANRYNRFNPYRRPFVREEGTNLDYIKDTMEFYNCVIFIQETDPDLTTHREFADTDWHFYAIGNIGDSKKTDNTRATDPDDRYECCVEIMDVELPLSDFPVDTMIDAMGYKVDDKTGEKTYIWAKDENLGILHEKIDGEYVLTEDTKVDLNKTYYVDILEHDDFSEDFTYGWRYLYDEDDEEAVAYCKSKWIEAYRFITTSSDEEFRNRLSDYFVVDSALYYYLFTTRYCMVDNRAKNTFWHYGKTDETDSQGNPIRKWDLCWDYDNDTSLGLNNYGKQVYRYGLEDIDEDDKGEEVFRESDSTFFCRLRDLFKSELASMYAELESKNAWHAESFLNECDAWQSEFPEELWRIDIERKYLRTYTTSFINGKGDAQFLVNMSNGKMKYHRRQWERSQEKYMASKFQTSTASGDNSVFRCSVPKGDLVVAPNYRLKLTPYAYMYLNVKYGTNSPIQVRAIPNVAHEIPFTGAGADIVDVYSSSIIQDFGDLSTCYATTADTSKASRIKKLVLGNDTEGYTNPGFTTLTTGANTLLEELNVENVTGLNQSLDLSKLTNLKSIYAFGTEVSSVIFAEGGKISYAELPAINSLELKNLMYLSDENLKLENYDNVVDLTVENCPMISALDLLHICKNTKRLRLIDIDLGEVTYEYFENNIFKLKGLNSAGEETSNAWLTGTAKFKELTGTQFQDLKKRYPYLTISYDLLVCSVTFKDTDLTTTLYTQTVYNEANCEDPVNLGLLEMPTKDQTVSTVYSWSGWSKLPDGQTADISPLLNVDDDITIYPTFNESVRTYEVSFYNNDGALLNTYMVGYGTEEFVYPDVTPMKANVINPDNYEFKSWNPEPKNIVGPMNCYATYNLKESAIYNIELNDIEYVLDVEKLLLTITKYKNELEKTIRIPDKYLIGDSEYTVSTIIGKDASNENVTGFSNCNLEYVILPETITNIGAYAFYNNKNITTITIPESVTHLGASAFEDCNGLLEVYYNAADAVAVRNANTDHYVFNNTSSILGYTVYVGDNVRKIPSYVFTQTTSSVNKLYGARIIKFTENSKCTSIESHAFSRNYCVEVNLPKSLKEIRSSAFEVNDFDNVVIPENVTTLSSDCFSYCYNLTHVYIPASLETMSSAAFRYTLNAEFEIEEGSKFVWKNHCMIDTETKTVLFGREDSIIPDDMNLTTIDSYCFNEVNIVSLIIPDGITRINQYAVYNCKMLTTIELPMSLTYIDSFGLYGLSCSEIILPMNLQHIGLYSLVDNPNLKSITIPASVRSIGYQFLRGCTELTSVIFKTSELVISKPNNATYDLFNGNEKLSYIEVNWNSDGSVNNISREVSYPFANINKDAPWKAGTNSSDSQIIPVTIKFSDKELVYNIDGTITEKTEEMSE